MGRISGKRGKERVLRVNNIYLYHWILLFVKIKSGALYILDPLKEQASSITISMARDIVNCIIQKKFGATNDCIVGKMKHYFQQEVVSCCVLTCYYAYQIAQGEFIPCFFPNLKKRQKTKSDNIHIYGCRFKTFYLKLKFYVLTYKCISQIFNFWQFRLRQYLDRYFFRCNC